MKKDSRTKVPCNIPLPKIWDMIILTEDETGLEVPGIIKGLYDGNEDRPYYVYALRTDINNKEDILASHEAFNNNDAFRPGGNSLRFAWRYLPGV